MHPEPSLKEYGAYSLEYARLTNPEVIMIIAEARSFYDPRDWDNSPSDVTFRQIAQYRVTVVEKCFNFLSDLYDRGKELLKRDTLLFQGAKYGILKRLSERIQMYKRATSSEDPTFDELATVKEKIQLEGREEVYRMFFVGNLIRALECEIEQGGPGVSKLEGLRDEAMKKLTEWNKEVENKYDVRAVPIKNLVSLILRLY